jgi:hypothetical protein
MITIILTTPLIRAGPSPGWRRRKRCALVHPPPPWRWHLPPLSQSPLPSPPHWPLLSSHHTPPPLQTPELPHLTLLAPPSPSVGIPVSTEGGRGGSASLVALPSFARSCRSVGFPRGAIAAPRAARCSTYGMVSMVSMIVSIAIAAPCCQVQYVWYGQHGEHDSKSSDCCTVLPGAVRMVWSAW